MPVELGLDMSPSKGSSGHLLTSMSSSDFSFPKGRGEGDEVEVGRRKRLPSQVFLPPPKQLEPLGLGETSSLDRTDESDEQKVGSHLEEAYST